MFRKFNNSFFTLVDKTTFPGRNFAIPTHSTRVADPFNQEFLDRMPYSERYSTPTNRPYSWPLKDSPVNIDGYPRHFNQISFYIPDPKNHLKPSVQLVTPETLFISHKDTNVKESIFENIFGVSPETKDGRIGNRLYEAISFFVQDYDFPGGLNIERTYSAWFDISVIYIWIILSRLRTFQEPKVARVLFDAFFDDALLKMPQHGLTNAYAINKALDYRGKHYYGFVHELDRVEKLSDDQLAEVLWKTIFDTKSRIISVEALVQTIRHTLWYIDRVPKKKLLELEWCFPHPTLPFLKPIPKQTTSTFDKTAQHDPTRPPSVKNKPRL